MVRQSHAPTLLLTRPELQSQRFAAEVRAIAAKVPVVISPLMRTEYLRPALPAGPFRAVILSSETGAEAAFRLRQAGQDFPELAFCVGDRTAEAAGKAGFRTLSAKGDAVALMALVRQTMPVGPLLHLRGENTTGDLALSLTKGGLETVFAVVYAQRPLPLTPEAITLLQQDSPLVVPVFSPRSAVLLAQAFPAHVTAPLWIAAISQAAASAAKPLDPAHLVISSAPDGENMLHAVTSLLSWTGNA